MATTEADKHQAADDFAAGYQEENEPSDMGDDEAFGLTPEPDEAPGTGEPTGAPAETVAADPAPEGDGAPAVPAAPSAPTEEPEEPVKAPTDESVEPAGGDDTGSKNGEDDGDNDLKALADDFGPEFVALITAIIQRVAKKCAMEAATEHTAPYRQDIDAVIAELRDDKQRAHYEKIADVHPDFMDIAESEGFNAWIGGLEPDRKAHIEQVAKSGNAKQIIAMLQEYKATLAAPAGAEEAHDDMAGAIDNAEGVRSSGLKLPEAPSSQDDFAAAWNQH